MNTVVYFFLGVIIFIIFLFLSPSFRKVLAGLKRNWNNSEQKAWRKKPLRERLKIAYSATEQGYLNNIKPQSSRLNQNKFLKKIGLVPEYTEISLFIGIVVLGLLLLTNNNFRNDFSNLYLSSLDDFFLLVIIIIAMIITIYHIFSNKRKTIFAKLFIFTFAIMLFLQVAAAATFYSLDNTQGYLIIFPILNLIYLLIFTFLLRGGFIDTSIVSDKNVKRHELLIGLILTVVIFGLSQYIFENHWSITFSICLVYASLFNESVSKIFFKDTI